MARDSSLTINAQDAICWSLHYRTPREIGEAILRLMNAAIAGDRLTIDLFPFVAGYNSGRFRDAIPRAIRNDVLAAGICAGCGTAEQLTVDHIRPYSKGGTNDRWNLQCLCFGCNIRKSNKWGGA